MSYDPSREILSISIGTQAGEENFSLYANSCEVGFTLPSGVKIIVPASMVDSRIGASQKAIYDNERGLYFLWLHEPSESAGQNKFDGGKTNLCGYCHQPFKPRRGRRHRAKGQVSRD